jgi:hypothetical protein
MNLEDLVSLEGKTCDTCGAPATHAAVDVIVKADPPELIQAGCAAHPVKPILPPKPFSPKTT